MGAMVLASGAAWAQATSQPIDPNNGKGMDTHLFRPAMDSKGFFTVNGTEVLGHQDFSLGFVVDYGRNLLRVPVLGQRSEQLYNYSSQGTLQFTYGLFNRVAVGVNMTANLMQGDPQLNPANGQPVLPGAWTTSEVSASAIPAFAALHAKVKILPVDKGLGLSVGGHVGGSTSDAPRAAGGDPGIWYWPMLMVEKRVGAQDQFRVAANVGYRGHGATSTTLALRDGTFRDGSRVTGSLALSYRVLPALDLAAESYATYLLSDASSGVKTSAEAVGGIKVFVERNSYLVAGAGSRYTTGFEAADFRGFIGIVFEPSIGDRDGDGIKDDVDQCPDDPEDKDGYKDEDGCPDPDNDNDGILDIYDRCPDIPEDRDGDHDEDGCPEGNDGDRDGDGIIDRLDRCPDDPEDRDGFEDEDGCPELDNDKDGIPDIQDACKNDKEDADGFEDTDGCPDPDNDRDGIPDARDKCPDKPETFNGFEDEDGCPDTGSVIIKDNSIVILEKIKFQTNSAQILPESNSILDAVATTLNHNPEFLLLEVAGHADERSDDRYNLKLTQDRVNAVVRALVQRGVDKGRLRSKGYGEYCPEDPGHNEAAWEKNRRVEFKIVKTDKGPTGVELGCPLAAQKGVSPDPVP